MDPQYLLTDDSTKEKLVSSLMIISFPNTLTQTIAVEESYQCVRWQNDSNDETKSQFLEKCSLQGQWDHVGIGDYHNCHHLNHFRNQRQHSFSSRLC